MHVHTRRIKCCLLPAPLLSQHEANTAVCQHGSKACLLQYLFCIVTCHQAARLISHATWGAGDMQKLWQRVPELEKSTAVALEKMKLEESARRKLEERLITVGLLISFVP